MTRALRRAALPLMVLVAGVAASGCTADDSRPSAEAATAAESVSAVRITGTAGSAHHGDDGRVALTLAVHDELEVRRGDEVETHPVGTAGQHLDDVATTAVRTSRGTGTAPDEGAPSSAAVAAEAELTVVASGAEFSLDDVAIDGDDTTVVVSGVPVDGVPPARFEHWELTVGDAAVPLGTSSPTDATVLELDDADVASALAAAPQPPTIAGVSTTPEDTAPSAFTAQVEVLFVADGMYELDVNTPGSADERPRQVLLEVSSGAQEVVVASGDPAGLVTLTDRRPVPGGVIATVRSTGFDIATADRVSAQVRRQDSGAEPGPWNTLLGCTSGSASFQWRSSSDGPIKVGSCPDPYGWVVSHAVSPLLAPDPATVADAAAFRTPGSLTEHLGGLAAAVGATASAPGTRTLQVAVGAAFDTGAGIPVRLPVLLINTDAASFDAAEVATSIEAWRTAVASGPTTLIFDVSVTSTALHAPLLVTSGVPLPPQ